MIYLLYSKAGSTGIVYLVMMILAGTRHYKDMTANYIYIQSLILLMSFIALNGHGQDIYRSFHSKRYFLSINLLRRYTLIIINSIIINILLCMFFYLTKSEFLELTYYIFLWQLINTLLLLNFEYFQIKDCGIYSYIFSNTTINLIASITIFGILLGGGELDIEKIIKINFYSATVVGILFIFTAVILGIQRIRFKKIYMYYSRNIYIAGISLFSIALYNIDIIFIKIGYDQAIYSSYALGVKFSSILLMINSFAYSIAPKIIKNKNSLSAFQTLETFKNRIILINIATMSFVAIYIISIYQFTESIISIFVIFSIANLINLIFGIRLPVFILLKQERIIFNISKYVFIITLCIYIIIVIYEINIIIVSILLSSMIIIQSYIELLRLKRLLSV